MQNLGVLDFFKKTQIYGNMGKYFIFSVVQEIVLSIPNNSSFHSANIFGVSCVKTLLHSEETAVSKTKTALLDLTFMNREDFCYRNIKSTCRITSFS